MDANNIKKLIIKQNVDKTYSIDVSLDIIDCLQVKPVDMHFESVTFSDSEINIGQVINCARKELKFNTNIHGDINTVNDTYGTAISNYIDLNTLEGK